MTHLNLTGCKRRKRGGRVFGFRNFCEPGNPAEFNGPFRDNIRKLLAFASIETSLGGGMRSWSFQLEFHRHSPAHISMFVIEEPIDSSVSRHCRYCQFVGWGHHMICNEKFHLVLPSKETASVMEVCSVNEVNGGRSETMTITKPNFVELQGHLLHGVLHSNGFGHLLCINGVENGSELSGSEIMELWDRICTRLRARKVSLTDVAKKRNMDLRLIHGIAFGEPWFGRWGYKFGHGSYGVTEHMYLKAMEGLQSMPLCLLIQQFSPSDFEILAIFDRYQAVSSHSLLNLGQLLRFMHELKHCLPPESENFPIKPLDSRLVVETTCRWSQKRIEMAIRVIVEALKRTKFRWVSRQEVRDAARVYIGDTGLLDFVLKSLGNHVVGNYIVRRTLNPVTKVLEYCLEDISLNREGFPVSDKTKCRHHQITRLQLRNDMLYLYKYIFKEPRLTPNTGIISAISMATRVILDSKHLIKDYKGEFLTNHEQGREEDLNLLCTILLMNKEENKKPLMAANDSIILPPHATIRELKIEVERSFRETYWGLKSFVMDSIIDMNAEDSDMVFGLVDAGGNNLVIAGRITDAETDIEEIYERRKDGGVVDCSCGAKEDDGERLIGCDICDVQQHHRCARVSNSIEDVPHIFLCTRCEHDINFFRSLP